MLVNDMYGNGTGQDVNYEDLNDNSGYTDRKCPLCGEKLYNSTDIEEKEHDFCENVNCNYGCEDNEEGDKELKWKSDMVEWGEIHCPMIGKKVMTYYPNGTPAYDTVTNPFVDEDGSVYYFKFDHDEGGWNEDQFYIADKEEYENIEEVLFY